MRGADAEARLVVAVIPRGQADRHAGAAIRAGAQAVTVFVGRGYRAERELGASGLAVHAEKEVILTVVSSSAAGAVVRAMRDASGAECGPADHVTTIPVAGVVGLLEAIAGTRP